MNKSVIGSIAASIILTGAPFLVEASQLVPNPNPIGSTITVDTSDAFNSTGFTNAGTINIADTGILTNNVGAGLANGSFPNGSGTLINRGTLINEGTLSNFNASQVNNEGTFINTGAVSNVGLSGGVFTSTGTLVNSGSFAFTNDLPGSSVSGLTINSGSMSMGVDLAIGGTFINTNTGTFTFNFAGNSGTLINTNTGAVSGGRAFSNGGTLTNNGTLSIGLMANTGTVTNAGSINDLAAYIQTSGQTINNGTMTFATFSGITGFDLAGGTLSGTGTINGNVTVGNGATVSPGNSPGTFRINGNLLSSGNLLFEIGGLGSGQFDVLNINGDAAFTGGTMSFDFLGFTPMIGDSWNFLFANTITGWNSLSFLFDGLGPGETTQFSFLNGVETLTIAAVPEPDSFVLLVLGLAGLARWRFRHLAM